MKYKFSIPKIFLLSIAFVVIAISFSSNAYAAESDATQNVILKFNEFKLEETIESKNPVHINYEEVGTIESAQIVDSITGTAIEEITVEKLSAPNSRNSPYQVTKTTTHNGIKVKMVIHTTIYSSGGSFREFIHIGPGKLYIVSAFSNVVIENEYVYTNPSGTTNATKLLYSYSGTFRSDIKTSLSASAKNKFVSMGFALENNLYYRKDFSGTGSFSLY